MCLSLSTVAKFSEATYGSFRQIADHPADQWVTLIKNFAHLFGEKVE